MKLVEFDYTSLEFCPNNRYHSKVFKTEFANGVHFSSLEQLALELNELCSLVQQHSNSRNNGIFNACGIQATDLVIFVQFNVDTPYITFSLQSIYSNC